MAKGLGFNVQQKGKAKDVVDGNRGWAPMVKTTKKLRSRLNLGTTPGIKSK